MRSAYPSAIGQCRSLRGSFWGRLKRVELRLQGQTACIGTAADVWKNAPQRAAQAIDRLMAHRLVTGAAIVRWAFASQGLLNLDDQVANSLAWEVIYNAVNKTIARTQAGCT